MGPSNSALLLWGSRATAMLAECHHQLGFPPVDRAEALGGAGCSPPPPPPSSSSSPGRNGAIGWTNLLFIFFATRLPAISVKAAAVPPAGHPSPAVLPPQGWRHSPGPKRSRIRPAAEVLCTAARRVQSIPSIPSLLQAAAASQQLPGSPAASKHMPPSLPLEHHLAEQGEGAFRHPTLRRYLDFRACAGSFLCLATALLGKGL